jgi:hypothetical protein
MRKQGKLKDMKGKGDAGEDAVLNLCLDMQPKLGGLLYQSFSYPYQSNRDGKNYLGNIKFENKILVDYTDTKRTLHDEIDVLYVTDYRVFAIEVKAYHAKIRVYDNWVDKNGTPVDKSPVAQAEKHARHLYHALHSVLPEGNPNYIVPICCFVDRCELKDDRNIDMQYYVPVSILNNFKKTFLSRNQPLDYNLDIKAIQRKLNEVKMDVRKEFI